MEIKEVSDKGQRVDANNDIGTILSLLVMNN